MSNALGTPQVYAACLSSYNSGILHGRWIDCDQGEDHIREELAAMLKESPDKWAEEWAWHDYQFLPSISEGEDIERLAELGEAISEAADPEAFLAWLKWTGYDDLSKFEDEYRGQADSLADYCENYYYECYGEEELGPLAAHIDWSSVAYDFKCSGFCEVRCDGGVFIFESV